MNLLIVHMDQAVREDLELGLGGKFAADVFSSASMLDAIELIKANSLEPDLIIVEEQRDLSRLLKYLNKNRLSMPIVVVTDGDDRDVPEFDTSNIASYISQQGMLPRLLELIPQLIAGPSDSDRDYCPLPTHMLVRMSPLRGDVFIRLNRQKYVRLFSENDVCTADDINKYAVRKQIPYLYLKQADASLFLLDVSRDLEARLNQDIVNEADTEDATVGAIDSIQGYVRRFGLTVEALEAANKTVDITKKMIGESPKLNKIFEKYLYQTDRYLALHSLVLSHVAAGIAAQLSWNLKGTMYKLIMAAVLHDVTLENDELAAVKGLTELEERSDEFSEDDRKLFAKHPLKAGELVESMREVPNDVAEIIRQHHELPDGSGFPRHLTARNISPLASVFIVAHELVHRLMLNRNDFKIQDEFLDLVKRFNHGSSFKEILNAIDPYNPDQRKRVYE